MAVGTRAWITVIDSVIQNIVQDGRESIVPASDDKLARSVPTCLPTELNLRGRPGRGPYLPRSFGSSERCVGSWFVHLALGGGQEQPRTAAADCGFLPTGSFDLICPGKQPCVQRINLFPSGKLDGLRTTGYRGWHGNDTPPCGDLYADQ